METNLNQQVIRDRLKTLSEVIESYASIDFANQRHRDRVLGDIQVWIVELTRLSVDTAIELYKTQEEKDK